MMDEKRFEQEYRKLKHQAAPDLWARIEENLADHPERGQNTILVQKSGQEQMQKPGQEQMQKPGQKQVQKPGQRQAQTREAGEVRQISQGKNRNARIYGMAAAAAAILVLAAAPQLNRMRAGSSTGAVMNEAGVYPETWAAPEEEQEAAPDTGETVDAGAAGGQEAMQEAWEQAAAAAQANTPKTAVPVPPTMSAAEGASVSQDGVLEYSQLEIAAQQPMKVPEQAETVPEDAWYFSEGILKDTELLCGATVLSAGLETDDAGRAVNVVYELSPDEIYYSEDYTAGMESITVKSPIVKSEGDEAYVLYQLQPGGTYLLPLKSQNEGWELLYPFAPQIQVTGDGAYLFHSGYASLVTEDTIVVIGSQEGENDYYYDRMLLRNDDNFLSDVVSLVESQSQGRKNG